MYVMMKCPTGEKKKLTLVENLRISGRKRPHLVRGVWALKPPACHRP